MSKINPFKPMSPVQPGMFVGRVDEVLRLENALIQTRSGNPANFSIIGERGIGKSSLLFFIQALAEGLVDVSGTKLNFLVIDTDLDETATTLGVVRKIELGLRRTLAETEKARKFFQDAWAFLQRIEATGIKVRPDEEKPIDDIAIEEFAYSIADIVRRVCNKTYYDQELFATQYDGVLILIDEADNAPKSLRLGSFVKLLMERLQRRGCDKVMLGLAGLPELRGVLASGHPSSLRLFQEIELDRLTIEEARQVIHGGLEEASKVNGREIKISEEAEDFLVTFSEGFPHFIQQACYSAFEVDTDDLIDKDDVASGTFGKYGAMESIANRYYREDFYRRIKKDSYRQVLRIMADHLDEWVTKKQIQEKFKGKAATLDNAIKALRDRHIIVSKEGERGVYRLQHKGFAFWIKSYTNRQLDLDNP